MRSLLCQKRSDSGLAYQPIIINLEFVIAFINNDKKSLSAGRVSALLENTACRPDFAIASNQAVEIINMPNTAEYNPNLFIYNNRHPLWFKACAKTRGDFKLRIFLYISLNTVEFPTSMM